MKTVFLAVSLAGLLLKSATCTHRFTIFTIIGTELSTSSFCQNRLMHHTPTRLRIHIRNTTTRITELHVLHYQLYLPQNQFYQVYPPCCFVGGAIIPGRPRPISPRRPVIINPFPRSVDEEK